MKLRRSFLRLEIPLRIRRHAPHEIASGGGMAVAVALVGLPQRWFELFVSGGEVRSKGKTVAKKRLFGVPCSLGCRRSTS